VCTSEVKWPLARQDDNIKLGLKNRLGAPRLDLFGMYRGKLPDFVNTLVDCRVPYHHQ
jgi:hypothetical protein